MGLDGPFEGGIGDDTDGGVLCHAFGIYGEVKLCRSGFGGVRTGEADVKDSGVVEGDSMGIIVNEDDGSGGYEVEHRLLPGSVSLVFGFGQGKAGDGGVFWAGGAGFELVVDDVAEGGFVEGGPSAGSDGVDFIEVGSDHDAQGAGAGAGGAIEGEGEGLGGEAIVAEARGMGIGVQPLVVVMEGRLMDWTRHHMDEYRLWRVSGRGPWAYVTGRRRGLLRR